MQNYFQQIDKNLNNYNAQDSQGCSEIFAWEIPWMEEAGGLQSMGSERVRHNLATKQ